MTPFSVPQNYWSVSAAIFIEEEKDRKMVTFGSGLQCLGKGSLVTNGTLLFDSHAEVLCRRSFIKYLLYQLEEAIQGKLSILEKSDKKPFLYQLKSTFKVSMFISQSPCGDASMTALNDAQTDELREKNETKKRKFQESESSQCTIIRGRLSYNVLNCLRTKPGRIDADPTLSLSCSDKITKWICLGLNGALLSHIIAPIYLDNILITDYYDFPALNRALNQRASKFKETLQFSFHPVALASSPDLFGTSKSYRKSSSLKPYDQAFYWNEMESQTLTKGRRHGATKKDCISGKARAGISKLSMMQKFLQVVQLLPVTERPDSLRNLNLSYHDLKKASENYQEAKQAFYYHCFPEWKSKSTEFDNFNVSNDNS